MDIEVAFNTPVIGRKMAFRMSRFVRVSRVIDGPASLPWRILNGGGPAADIKGLLGLRIVNEVVKMWTDIVYVNFDRTLCRSHELIFTNDFRLSIRVISIRA